MDKNEPKIGMADAAKSLGISRTTLNRLVTTGVIKTVGPATKRSIPVSEIVRMKSAR